MGASNSSHSADGVDVIFSVKATDGCVQASKGQSKGKKGKERKWGEYEVTVLPLRLNEDKIAGRQLTICIGDLHGNLTKLKQLWTNLERKIGAGPFAYCNFIFLGDYCDRGPDTKGVLEFLSTLGERFPYQNHAFIAGNHDIGMASFLGELPDPPEGFDIRETWKIPCRATREGWWHGKGVETMHVQGRRWGGCMVGSYDSIYDSATTFNSYNVKLGDRDALMNAVPQHHKEFLRNLKWVHEASGPLTGEYLGLVAVHAGLDDTRSIQEQLDILRNRDVSKARVENIWGRVNVWDTPEELKKMGVLVISGHHGCLRTDSEHRLIVDESGGFENRPLAAVILPKKVVVRDTDHKRPVHTV